MASSRAAFPEWPLIRGPKATSSMNLMDYVNMQKPQAGDDCIGKLRESMQQLKLQFTDKNNTILDRSSQ
jgi:hypothetical protein